MKSVVTNLAKFSIVLFTIWILVFGLYQFGLNMNAGGRLVTCPFSGHSMSICKMNPMEHLQEWQNMFVADPNLGILLLSLVFSLLLIFFLYTKYHKRPDSSVFYKKSHFNFHTKPIFNILQESFSNGILNPKTF